jgi:poly(3-hydroxybutyrate) depolymerase
MGLSYLRRLLAVLACTALATVPSIAIADGAEVRIISGSGDFVFTDVKGDASRPVTVYTYLPRRADPRTAPIVFVLHGFHRGAQRYRDDWAKHADQIGFIVVAPLFDQKTWGNDYAYPPMRGKDGGPADPEQTSFALIEHLFDGVKAATGNTQPRYLIYGFSEGGQFVHRLVLTQPEARYARAVIGTPGWYTMPDFDVAWPYGLKHTRTDRAALKKIFERDVVLLLGSADTDPNHPDLSRKAKSMAEGPHRVARGQNFFKQAEARAAELKAQFAWRLQMVPGVAHEPKKMSPSAAALIAAVAAK